MSDEKLMKAEMRAKIATAKAEIAKAQCDLSVAMAVPEGNDLLANAKQDVNVAELRLVLSQKRLALTDIRMSMISPPAVI